MSEQKAPYLLQQEQNSVIVNTEQIPAPIDLSQIERMLLPLLNQVRKAQGKKPVIVPKG